MLTLTVARGLLYGDGGEVIRVGRTLILGLCDSAKLNLTSNSTRLRRQKNCFNDLLVLSTHLNGDKSRLVSYMEACDHAPSVMLDWHTYLSR